MWENQNTFSKNRLIFAIFKKLKNSFIKFWKDNISKSDNTEIGNKLRTYSNLKKEFEMENFLKLDIDKQDISNFVRIRINNSNLMIEKGRHRNLSLENRICPLCYNEVEDELHFSITCGKLQDCRSDFLKKLTDIIPNFQNMSKIDKFNFIFKSNDYDVMKCCIQGISALYKMRNSLS